MQKDIKLCARDNLRGQKSLGPLKMSLEMAQKVIVPQKKIMSQSFLNSGTLIVIYFLEKIGLAMFEVVSFFTLLNFTVLQNPNITKISN